MSFGLIWRWACEISVFRGKTSSACASVHHVQLHGRQWLKFNATTVRFTASRFKQSGGLRP